MLAGLIFAVQDADDRPDLLAATLPFAGLTLIEYQARLLIAAGVSQIVVVVARLTPELLGAIARIGRRGVTVDSVRSAAEAAGKLHPLSRLLVLADGLVTTEAVVRHAAREGGDVLLVLDESDAPPTWERIGGGMAWAGVAQLDGARIAEVAGMPRDYDVQSALLHAAGQAGAARRALPPGEVRNGHGIERRATALAARSEAVMAAGLAARPGWFDRWVVRPVASLLLPTVLRHRLPSAAMTAGAAAFALLGLGLIWFGLPAVGLAAAFVGTIAARLVGALAWMRDEARLARATEIAVLATPALAALLLGHFVDTDRGEIAGQIVALALVAATTLGERAAGATTRAAWWSDPPALLAVLLLPAALGAPFAGLALATAYATATLAAAIEALRQP